MSSATLEALAVVDSGPLIALARIGRFDLLHQLVERVLVPPAVWSEVTAGGDLPGAAEVRGAPWIEVVAPDPKAVGPLTILVDPGEAEAIALAQSLPGCLLLVDDAAARRVVERLAIRRTGTIGLLRLAKKHGLISLLRPELEKLHASGVFVRRALIEAVLADVGE